MKKRIKIKVIILIFILVLSIISFTPIFNAENSTTNNTKEYNFILSKPILNERSLENQMFTEIALDDSMVITEKGEPSIPYKFFSLIITDNKKIDDVTIEFNKPIEYQLHYPLLPHQGYYTFSQEQEIKFYYNNSKKIVERQLVSTSVEYCRGYKILNIKINPFDYNSNQKQLRFYKDIKVIITFDDSINYETLNQHFRNEQKDINYIKTLIDNPQDLNNKNIGYQTMYSPTSYSGGICNNSDRYEYVIITSNALNDTSESYNWSNLLNYWNVSYGWSCIKVTVEDIDACSDYWNTTSLYNDTQAHIKEFCEDAYEDWETEYILLGGDWDTTYQHVPYREFFCGYNYLGGYYPCDLYYTNLDSTWRNGIYWGYKDGATYNHDSYSELHSGRVPVQTGNDISNFVEKIIEYKNHQYFNKTAFFGGYLGWYSESDERMEALRNGTGTYIEVTDGFTDWNNENSNNTLNISKRVYYGWGDNIPADEISAINNGEANIINHISHGSSTSSMNINYVTLRTLTNEEPIFFTTSECSSGAYHYHVNTTTNSWLLYSNHSGAYASIQNTGYGWGHPSSPSGPNQYGIRQFWDYVFNSNLTDWRFGNITTYMHDKVGAICDSYPGVAWLGAWYGAHLFGDPCLRLKFNNESYSDISIEITSIQGALFNDHLQNNTEYIVNIVLSNLGQLNITNITVNLTLDGTFKNSTNISFLNSTKQQTVSLGLLIPEPIPSDGTSILDVTAEFIQQDDIDSNNEDQMTLIIGPDLETSNFNMGYYERIILENHNYLNTTITNKGSVNSTSDIEISFYINDTLQNTTNVSLNSTESQDISFYFNGSGFSVGVYNLTITSQTLTGENYTENQNVTGYYIPFDASVNSSIDNIIPYNHSISPLEITATANVSYENITLYYRWSEDNQSWGYNNPASEVSGTTVVDHEYDYMYSNINDNKKSITRNATGDFWWVTEVPDWSSYDIYLYSSNGTTWDNTSVNISAEIEDFGDMYSVNNPLIAVDSNNVIHVIAQGWNLSGGEDFYYFLLYANSTDWNNPQVIYTPTESNNIKNCWFAIDSNDKLHVIFLQGAYYYFNSSDGVSWSSIKRLTYTSTGVYSADLQINSTNCLHFVFSCTGLYSDNLIQHMWSTPGGDSWVNYTSDNVTSITPDNEDFRSPCLTIGRDDTLHVSFKVGTNLIPYRIGYTYNDSSGWSDYINISDEDDDLDNPCMSMTLNGEIYVGYINETGLTPYGPTYYNYYNGTVWSSRQQIDGSDGSCNGITTPWSFYPLNNSNPVNVPRTGNVFLYNNQTSKSIHFINLTDTYWDSQDGQSWNKWNSESNPDTFAPWQWNFNFPNSTGYYEFYSIARNLGDVEPAPDEADAACYYNPQNAPFDTYLPYPANQSTGIERPPTNLSILINSSLLNITFYSYNITAYTPIWNTLRDWSNEEGNKRFSITQLSNYSNNYLWGNTTYYWSVNVSNGSSWINNTYQYTTGGSRYDVVNSGDVTSTDVTNDWNHRIGEQVYDGIFDVDYSGDITATDCSLIWANRT